MTSFFKKMQESSRYYSGSNTPNILRTHPIDAERIAEAEKLGFEQIFISKYNLPAGRGVKTEPEWQKYKIKIKTVAKVEEVFNALFG
jgi:predicted Zn-dependent protease